MRCARCLRLAVEHKGLVYKKNMIWNIVSAELTNQLDVVSTR